jgi:hypothetical protein
VTFRTRSDHKREFVQRILFERLAAAARGPVDAINWRAIHVPGEGGQAVLVATVNGAFRQIASVPASRRTPFDEHSCRAHFHARKTTCAITSWSRTSIYNVSNCSTQQGAEAKTTVRDVLDRAVHLKDPARPHLVRIVKDQTTWCIQRGHFRPGWCRRGDPRVP